MCCSIVAYMPMWFNFFQTETRVTESSRKACCLFLKHGGLALLYNNVIHPNILPVNKRKYFFYQLHST
jgi:hypothetical protein